MKQKDTEVSFRLAEARKEAEQLQSPPGVQMLPSPVEQEKVSLLAELNPRAATLDARAGLEQTVREAAVRFDIEHAASRPLAYLVKELKGWLAKGLGSLLDDLRQIENNTTHNADARMATNHDAKNFRQLVDKAIISLQAAPPAKT